MYRVINVNSREVLTNDPIETYEEACRIAEEIEQHETQPQVTIQKLIGGEWLQGWVD